VPAAAGALVAPAAAEHGVAGDPQADPGGVDVLPDRRDDTAPLVPDPDGIFGLAAVQVGHLAGEEFGVGAAHARPLDIHHHLTRTRLGWLDVPDLSPAGAGDDKGPHGHLAATTCRGSAQSVQTSIQDGKPRNATSVATVPQSDRPP
jgi:hypothetical protein